MSFSILYFINIIFLTICSTFFVSTKGMRIRRVFYDTPLTLFEEAINPIDMQENINPHFSINRVKKGVEYYLLYNLKGLVSEYSVTFFPYKVVNENGVKKRYFEDSYLVKNIEVNFKCNYIYDFKIDTSQFYSISNQGLIKNEY